MKITKVLVVCLILVGFFQSVPATAFTENVAKNAALQMTATLENSTTALQYNYAENINDGRGITFGAIGFCTGTYDGNELVKYYTALNPNNNLAKYIPALNVIDAGPHTSADGDGNPSTVGLSGFIEAVESNTDPLFKQAQMDKLDELYWDPSVQMANSIGAQYNLTLAFIYDMSVRHGADGAQSIINQAKSSLGGTPATEVNETTFLNKLISLRDKELANEGLGDVDRDDGFKAVLSSGNVNLTTPYNFTAYGDSFVIKAGVYTDSPSTVYALTVTSGTGDGTYAPGTQVTITADAPASGQVFDKWTGDTTYLSSLTSSSSTLTMPSRAISLTATYKTLEPLKYALNVVSGTGDGGYVSGTQVTITADSPIMGREFDKWTGDIEYVASLTSSTTKVTMPSKAINLTATYRDKIDTYYLTVNSGSGDGYYAPNAKVSITAAPAVSGMVFDQWTGDISYLSSVNSATATLTMPAKAIALTAHYVAIPTPVTEHILTITNGTGDGSYIAGTKVNIQADAPVSGQVFYRWTGDTTYLDGIYSSAASVTMPSRNITLTATYKPATLTKYTLTVTNGTGDGSYAQGTIVSIKADSPSSGKVFDKWTGDIEYVANVTSSTTNLTMPAKAITLIAQYQTKDSSLPDGTLIKLPDSNKVYIIINGEKKWISTPEMFQQLGCDWANIKILTQEDITSYTDFEDNLIRVIGQTKVYLVTNGIRRHIPTPQVFQGYGFNWNDIKEVSLETQAQYRETYLVRQSGREEVYYLSPNGIRKHIPTQTIFDSYQDNWQDVQIISQQEMESYPISNLIRLEGSNDVYLLESSIKRHITSSQVFTRYGYDWNRIITVNRTEFDYYRTGSEVR